jgi:hypothetical protein
MGRGGYKTEVVVWRAVAQAALATQEALGLVLVPAEVLRFLRGDGPLEGCWFGDRKDGQGFWWRKHLPASPIAGARQTLKETTSEAT